MYSGRGGNNGLARIDRFMNFGKEVKGWNDCGAALIGKEDKNIVIGA